MNLKYFLLPFTIYIFISLLLLSPNFTSINVDTTAYVNITHRYIYDGLYSAINGFWSPLFSWLLIPFFIFKVNPILSIKLLGLITGILTLIGIRKLCYRFLLNDFYTIFILIILIPFLIYYAYYFTPDLLSLCVLTYYLYFILSDRDHLSTRNAIIIGSLGALAYFAKNYNFYFFVFHFSIFYLIRIFIIKNSLLRKKLCKNLIIGLSIFFLVSGLWITTISLKYKSISISNAAKFNFAFDGPYAPNTLIPGFQKPLNGYSTSIWDDPSYINLKPYEWSIFSSPTHIKYVISLVGHNIIMLTKELHGLSYLSFLAIIYFTSLCVQARNKILHTKNLICALLVFAIYPMGYYLTHVEGRYIIILYVFVLIYSALFLQNTFIKTIIFNKILLFFTFLFFILATYSPAKDLYEYVFVRKSTGLITNLKNSYNIYNTSIASNSEWRSSIIIAFLLKSKLYYFGDIQSNNEEQIEKLNIYKIPVFLEWYFAKKTSYLPPNYKLILANKQLFLNIYKRVN